MSLNVLILGVNGFIGNHLARAILNQTDWQLVGLDLADDNIDDLLSAKRFDFVKQDLLQSFDWVEQQLQHCDVVLPLAAIANPAIYVEDPLRVFELDFEANLAIIKKCIPSNTRVVFPSTSEVYGMATDAEFDESTTNLITGPIQKERWIYSCSKQMLDRVIYAYGKHRGLEYSLFRPFNWIGPKLDTIFGEKANSSRVVTKFLGNIIQGNDITLVDGGKQKRSFTYIDDAIAALLKIIENKDDCARSEIFNIGNPNNNISIRELADGLIARAKQYPKYKAQAEQTNIIEVPGTEFYGKGYQDVSLRVPSIKQAKARLNWEPTTDMDTALNRTVSYYLTGDGDE